jgi:hypothetical protein
MSGMMLPYEVCRPLGTKTDHPRAGRPTIGRWQQGCICKAQRRARLGYTCRCLRNVPILFDSQRDEARQ